MKQNLTPNSHQNFHSNSSVINQTTKEGCAVFYAHKNELHTALPPLKAIMSARKQEELTVPDPVSNDSLHALVDEEIAKIAKTDADVNREFLKANQAQIINIIAKMIHYKEKGMSIQIFNAKVYRPNECICNFITNLGYTAEIKGNMVYVYNPNMLPVSSKKSQSCVLL